MRLRVGTKWWFRAASAASAASAAPAPSDLSAPRRPRRPCRRGREVRSRNPPRVMRGIQRLGRSFFGHHQPIPHKRADHTSKLCPTGEAATIACPETPALHAERGDEPMLCGAACAHHLQKVLANRDLAAGPVPFLILHGRPSSRRRVRLGCRAQRRRVAPCRAPRARTRARIRSARDRAPSSRRTRRAALSYHCGTRKAPVRAAMALARRARARLDRETAGGS